MLLVAELPRLLPGDGSGYRGIPADGRSTASSARISSPAVSSYLRKKTSAPPTASPASVMPIARQSYRSRKGSVRHWRSASSSRFACPRQPIIAPFRSRRRRAASRPISCGELRPIRSCQHIRRATSKPRQRFLPGFIPRLQFEVRRGGWRAAERERDLVVKFEIGQKLFGKLQLTNKLDLDARGISSGWPNGLRPARNADCLVDGRLRDGGIDWQVLSERSRGEHQEQDQEVGCSHFAEFAFGLPASIALRLAFAASSAPAFGPSALH